MKVWMVNHDKCDTYGTDMHCYGIFSTKEKADECAKRRGDCEITSFTIDENCDECLAFYVE